MFRLRAARTPSAGANSFVLGALNHRHAGYQSPRATEVAPTKILLARLWICLSTRLQRAGRKYSRAGLITLLQSLPSTRPAACAVTLAPSAWGGQGDDDEDCVFMAVPRR